MADAPAAKKGETSNAQGRFVVSLPKEVGEQIDNVGEKISAQLKESTGVAFELTRAQIVQALVRQALDSTEAAETPAAA